MIIISVGAVASILQGTVNTVVNGDLARGAAERSLVKRMKGHVIVFGYAHLGRYVADKLGELVKDVFDPNLRIQEDDTLLVFGDPAGLHELEETAEAT